MLQRSKKPGFSNQRNRVSGKTGFLGQAGSQEAIAHWLVGKKTIIPAWVPENKFALIIDFVEAEKGAISLRSKVILINKLENFSI